MRKMKNINGYLVVRFNDREKREHEGTALGNFGVIDAELYALGQALAENCPQNDCVVYRNIFQQARELDEALDGLDGYAAGIIRRELRARVRELGRMYRTNYAISNYRKGARA